MIPVECELAQILITESPMSPQVIVLREKNGVRSFPIEIGLFEAVAINRKVLGEEFIRPLTHDLLASVIENMGGKVSRVVVNDLVGEDVGGGTFYGLLVIDNNGEEIEIDCRPSDAIGLAVRVECPIFVAEHVLEAVSGKQNG